MRIENRIEIQAPVSKVFDAIADLDTLPLHFPGVREAHVRSVRHNLVGTRIDLTMEDGHRSVAEVKQYVPRREMLIADARGITEEFVLHPTKNGTTEMEEILVVPDNLATPDLRSDAEARLRNLAEEIERRRE